MAVFSSPPSCSWSSLSNDLLEKILICLNNPLDLLRCCHVCTSWRSAASQVCRKSVQVPLLIMVRREEEEAKLYDIFTGNEQEIHLPLCQERRICSVANGWLLTISLTSPFKVNLFNPILSTEILLPLATKFPSFCGRGIESYIKRCITSLTPLDPDCFVLVIYDERKLAFCRPGDADWRVLQAQEEVAFVDIMCYKGHFYATDIKGKIYGCDLGSNPKIVLLIEPPFHQGHQWQKYLVESIAGDFLMICRKWNWVVDDEEEDGIATSFEVYKVDLGSKEWGKIETLGDEALFLGRNGSMSAPSSTGNSAAALPRGNKIYFIHNSYEAIPDDGDGFKHASIYDLETSRIKRLKTSETWTSQFHWITLGSI